MNRSNVVKISRNRKVKPSKLRKQGRPNPRKGKFVGPKPPLKIDEIWQIRVRLELAKKWRELAMFNLGIDSMLRASDLVSLRVCDVTQTGKTHSRGKLFQQKTREPVTFGITERTRKTTDKWIEFAGLQGDDYLFISRARNSAHITTRQYARIFKDWVVSIGLDPKVYGTHSMRRSKATILYNRTKDYRAIQMLLGHSDIENTVRYLGVNLEDAIDMTLRIAV